VQGLTRGLRDPREVLGMATQRLDDMAERLRRGLGAGVSERRARLAEVAAHLRPRLLAREIEAYRKTLADLGHGLGRELRRRLSDARTRVEGHGKLLASYSYERVLERGFAVVRDAKARLLTSVAAAKPGLGLRIEFRDGTAAATVDGIAPPRKRPRATPDDEPQGSLL
jgi:exodeoxyribonuclease VII large subunit